MKSRSVNVIDDVVSEVELNAPVSLVVERLIRMGFDVFPGFIYCYHKNNIERDKKYLLNWANEVGFPTRTVIVASMQGPCIGGGEMYVTDAPPEIVEKADSEAWEQTF